MDIKKLLEITSLLVSKKNFNELIDEMLNLIREVVNADAGSVYLYDEDKDELIFKYTQNDTINVAFNEFAIPVDENSIAGYCALKKEIFKIDDVYMLDEKYPFRFNKDFDKISGYRTKSMLLVPIFDAKNNLISVLQLINKKQTPFGKKVGDFESDVIAFNESDLEIIHSLSGIIGVALENSLLYESIENMFEGFIRASIQAVESRDPITKGHTERVYRITWKIAEEMDKDDTLFPDFKMSDVDWKLLKYATLLHDFGKIGVREAVLMKPKKLYNDQFEKLLYKAKLYACLNNLTQSEYSDLIEDISKSNEPSLLEDDLSEKIEKYYRLKFKDCYGEEYQLIDDVEFKQLSVKKGTLTDEERREIESHVLHTYEYLTKIPWTKELKDVPKIACLHHEKLDGTGYPFGLKSDEIHIFGKIMAIADIYDALTAKDRPYKKAVPIDIALKIIKEEADKGKLDKKITNFFIDKKIYNMV
ncbi:metal dependent phosphohydrolase [Deferribacter desulfuricans SSM1]|uniref:Metal dependent phosphohydrolase n=1 Tax=Deferribacter desulfuricans (strain DSM 14783 / JCM 11476 / NBRC 101012 / SSM1) TaxID=639282 RepID=D3P8I4_DEFDS|nr:HD family phosphohydrolase [Deferribacter desulfuricans]BAI81024.1 metal dependent phosphohydrolase [Deferribacter desulfuricans SSM1]